MLAALLAVGLYPALGEAKTLRVVCYNLACAGQASDNNITGPTHSIPTVLQGIGLHHLGTNAQPVDLLGLEELRSTTLGVLVSQLNSIYGAGAYAYDPTADPTTGGGTDGLVYNTATVQVISARALKTGQTVLLQSNGTYIAAHSPGGGTNGITRGPMLYQVRPIGSTSTDDLYLYISHARSTTDNTVGDARYAEAQEVRSDAKYKLPAGVHIIYMGDWNLFKGSGENAYLCLTGQVTSDGLDWSDSSAMWANTNPTQAYDALSKSNPPTTAVWGNVSGDAANYIYGDSTSSLTSRIDVQLMNGPMFGAYNNKGGVQIATDSADPYDSLNFPSSKYPYAMETFGNNGSSSRNSAANNANNHSLDDLLNTVPNAQTVYAALKLTGSGSSFTGSDHYPVVADYNVVSVTSISPVLTPQGFIANGSFQLKLVANPSTTYGIEASVNLTDWSDIGSGATDGSGILTYQDADAANYVERFYRAYSPFPRTPVQANTKLTSSSRRVTPGAGSSRRRMDRSPSVKAN